jgi:hypothetical protein
MCLALVAWVQVFAKQRLRDLLHLFQCLVLHLVAHSHLLQPQTQVALCQHHLELLSHPAANDDMGSNRLHGEKRLREFLLLALLHPHACLLCWHSCRRLRLVLLLLGVYLLPRMLLQSCCLLLAYAANKHQHQQPIALLSLAS